MRTDAQGRAEPTRVLLVEDDARAEILIGEALRNSWGAGLVLTTTQRLADATQELLERGASCVLLDLAVTMGDPIGALEQLRAAAPEVPVITLSDARDDQLALSLIRRGVQDYLVKPDIQPSLLTRTVRYSVERKRSEVRLVHEALHDPLTGLPNRALFLDRLGVALDRSRRTNAKVAVLFVDVDNFKQINDSMGHAAGDRLLTELSARLRTMLRPMDTVSRFGGDEFTLLFEDLTSEQEVVLIAERIRQAVSTPMGLDQGETAVTVSIGIAMVTDPTVPPETVIREADAAMYRAKEQGPSRYEVYGAAIRQEAHERLGIEDALRHAVERGELHVHYQPKISLNGHVGVNGFEAFVLWDHPQRGLLTPDEFAPLAEETGTLKPIAEFVLDEALRDIRRWREARPGVTVSVNLFPHQLEDADLAPMLARALEASGTTPDALWLEVSESALSANPQVSTRALTAMKALGVMVAIDDYGTSSSMLLNLRSLPVDSIKIHRSFVRALGSDPAEATVVGAVVELGHALGLRVEAEGVETDQQLAQLRLLGCDGAQGPLFSPAVPSEEADVLLTAG